MSLTLLDYPINNEWWLDYANELRSKAVPYSDTRYELSVDHWLTYVPDHCPEIDKIKKDFNIEAKSRFYWLLPNSKIPEHVDNGTLCSLNFIFSENAAPINIEGKEYFYKQALLDTSKPHSVNNGKEERVMFKLSIHDQSYEQLLSKIPYKLIS